MSALGGRPRRVLSAPFAARDIYPRGSAPQWSSNGEELACPLRDAGRWCSAEILNLNNLETRRVSLPAREGHECTDLSWSPDGRYFAYVTGTGGFNADINQIWVLPASGGDPIPVTDGWTNDWSPTWSIDQRKLFFVSNRGGSVDLWQQRTDEDGPSGERRHEIAAARSRLSNRCTVRPDARRRARCR